MKLKSAGVVTPRTTAYFFGGVFGGEVLPLPEPDGGVLLPELEPELEPELPLLLGGVVVLMPESDGAALLEEAGGVAAGAFADWLDGCLAQAVKSTAAASALRATFVFIDGTPVE